MYSAGQDALDRALQHPELYAIPEYVAAGPQLLQEWKQAVNAGGHPRGAALVSAAVDLNRAGLGGAIPVSALVDLHHRYLDENGGNLLRPESLDDAIAWASIVHAMVNLGALLVNRGAVEEAELWTRQVASAAHPAGIFNLAVIVAEKGNVDEAKSLYATACEGGNSDAAVNPV